MDKRNRALEAASLALLFASTALAGCFAVEATGTLTVCVRDAVSDQFRSVFVTFTKVEAKRTADRVEETETTTAANNTTTPSPTTTTTTTATATGTATSPNATLGPGAACVEPAPPQAGANTTVTRTATVTETAGPTAVTPTETATEETNETQEPGERQGTWVELETDTRTIDLLQFRGDLRALLESEQVQEGTYSHVRLHIDSAWGVTKDDSRVEFKVPSGVLRINRGIGVSEDRETVVIVDFDLERSIVQAGQSGQWIFKPVVQVEVIVLAGTTAAETQ